MSTMTRSAGHGAPSGVGAPLRKPQGGAKAVGSFVPRLTRQAFEKFGFSTATLITDWSIIVGSDVAAWTAPERLKWPRVPVRGDSGEPDQGRGGATLILRVDQGRALDIQYKGRQIIERINAYFGYRAVVDLRIVQSPTAVRPPPPVRVRPADVPHTPPAALSAIKDDGLRAALERLAAGIAARHAKPRRSV